MKYKFNQYCFNEAIIFGFCKNNLDILLLTMMMIIIVLLILIAILVTNLKKVRLEESTLIQNNKQLRNLMNAVPDIICFKDRDGKYISMNKTCKSMLDLESKPYIGKTNIDLVEFIPKHEKVLRSLANSDNRVWKEGESRNEEVITMNNGEKKVFDVIKIPIFNKDGSKRGLGVFGRDITESKVSEQFKKKLEKARENDKIKTEFFANVSHELRTPLNVMLSSIQLIQLYISNGKILDDENNLCKNIKILRQNALRLLKLINNLIDMTKIDSGFYVINLKNCDIVNLIEDITMSVVEYVESNNINLIFDTNVEEKVLACDPEKIERIMLNLLSNAAKFTPPQGCIEVNLTDKNDKFLISVKDTGIGIPLEQQKDIFERFKQINGTSISNYQGSGIGLSLVKSMVELHKGRIWLNSEENKGCEFIIELPVKVMPDQEEYRVSDDAEKKFIGLEFSDFVKGSN